MRYALCYEHYITCKYCNLCSCCAVHFTCANTATDVGMFVLAQAEAVMRMNPSLNIKCYSTRVGPDTEELFDDDFFEAIDGVCNALDNVQVREQYI